MSNYPAGAFSDPRAPFNQPDLPDHHRVCEYCQGGKVVDISGDTYTCDECGGTGSIEVDCDGGPHWCEYCGPCGCRECRGED